MLDDLPGEDVFAAHRAKPRAHRTPSPKWLGRGEVLAVHALVPERPIPRVRDEREDLGQSVAFALGAIVFTVPARRSPTGVSNCSTRPERW